jgi:hypothetical protein
MTRVVVNAGVCGMEVIIAVNKVAARKVKIEITSACKMLTRLGQALAELDPYEVLKGVHSEVYQQASKDSLHASCPVPAAILKAVEVEAEMALPCDAVIHFEMPPGREIPVIRRKEAKHASN